MWRAGLPALGCAAAPVALNVVCRRVWGRFAPQRGQARSPQQLNAVIYVLPPVAGARRCSRRSRAKSILLWRAGLPALGCEAAPVALNVVCRRVWGRFAPQRGQARSPQKLNAVIYVLPPTLLEQVVVADVPGLNPHSLWRAGLPALGCEAAPVALNVVCRRVWGRFAPQRGQARSPQQQNAVIYVLPPPLLEHVVVAHAPGLNPHSLWRAGLPARHKSRTARWRAVLYLPTQRGYLRAASHCLSKSL